MKLGPAGWAAGDDDGGQAGDAFYASPDPSRTTPSGRGNRKRISETNRKPETHMRKTQSQFARVGNLEVGPHVGACAAGGRAPRAAAAASRRLARRRRAGSRVAPPTRGGVLRWLQSGPLKRHARRACEQPPVGGHRGGGQALPGLDPVRLVSLVGRVCSSSAQKEEKNSTTVLTVSFLGAPFSPSLKSWLVVARSASAPLRLAGHLGWVHRQEARVHGRMGAEIRSFATKITRRQGGGQVLVP